MNNSHLLQEVAFLNKLEPNLIILVVRNMNDDKIKSSL